MNTSIKKELKKNHFRVSIFGSARIEKDNPAYKLVKQLSKMIAEEGIDLVTGGGPGLMHAANAGHKEGKSKAHSLGLVIKLDTEKKGNPHLDIEKQFTKFSERLDDFMMLSNVVVVAPGGIGTLLEFFYTWQLVQVKHICNIPIILLGDMWKPLLEWIEKYPLKKKLLNKEDLDNVIVVKNCPDAMKIIKEHHKAFKEGKSNLCITYRKYK